MTDPTPTKRSAEAQHIAQMRDAYLRLGFRLCRMGGHLDDDYRALTSSTPHMSDQDARDLYALIIRNYGRNAWERLLTEGKEDMP